MMALVVRATTVCALVFALIGCGSKGKPTAAAGTIDKSTADTLASGSTGNQIVTMAQPKPSASLFGSTPATSRGMLRSALMLSPEYRNIARFTDRDDCDPDEGDTTDADADGIPKSQVMTFNCNTTNDGYTIVATGTISITDANDDDKKSGFSFKIDNVHFVLTATSRATTSIEMTMNGEYAVTVADAAITAAGSVTMDMSAGGKSISIGFWGSTTATGTDAADPFAAGTITVDNWYDFEYDATKYTLHITSEDLTYGVCARPDGRPDDSKLNGGKLKIQDGVPNTIEVSFSSACVATWTYNGESL